MKEKDRMGDEQEPCGRMEHKAFRTSHWVVVEAQAIQEPYLVEEEGEELHREAARAERICDLQTRPCPRATISIAATVRVIGLCGGPSSSWCIRVTACLVPTEPGPREYRFDSRWKR